MTTTVVSIPYCYRIIIGWILVVLDSRVVVPFRSTSAYVAFPPPTCHRSSWILLPRSATTQRGTKIPLIAAGARRSRVKVEENAITLKTTSSTRRKERIRRLLETILERYDDFSNHTIVAENSSSSRRVLPLPVQWGKLRKYLYKSVDTLTISQIHHVCDYLDTVLDLETQQHAIQTTPQILQQTVSSKLQPTIQFLQSLYGSNQLASIVRRNPTLLLTRGTGYNVQSTSMDLVSIYFQNDWQLSDTTLQQLRDKAPFLFIMPLSKLMKNMSLLKHVLSKGLDDDKVRSSLLQILQRYPTILQLSPETLHLRIEFLKCNCLFPDNDIAVLILRNPSFLMLSTKQNVLPTWDYFMQHLGLSCEELRQCVLKHPSLLNLAITSNLQPKVDYWNSLERIPTREHSAQYQRSLSLAARILRRAPSVYSLNLESLHAKVDFLAWIWGIDHDNTTRTDGTATDNNMRISDLISEDPNILTLSLEDNLKPTVHFYNRTGYIQLDYQWHKRCYNITTTSRSDDNPGSSEQLVPSSIRPRHLSASLTRRLLPRWHYYIVARRRHSNLHARVNDTTANADTHTDHVLRLPLHILATATDAGFCQYCDARLDDYKAFRQRHQARWKLAAQLEAWIGTEPISLLEELFDV